MKESLFDFVRQKGVVERIARSRHFRSIKILISELIAKKVEDSLFECIFIEAVKGSNGVMIFAHRKPFIIYLKGNAR